MRALAVSATFGSATWAAVVLVLADHAQFGVLVFAAGWLLAAMLVAAERETAKAARVQAETIASRVMSAIEKAKAAVS